MRPLKDAMILGILVSTLGVEVLAFGAGYIPGFSWFKGKAWRHGDVDAVFKKFIESGGTAPATPQLDPALRWKYEDEDVERLYFGNWLRDYSQVLDIKTLKVINKDILMALLKMFAYISAGYGGGEYEITKERLGVYLPVEHIDNPKGYGDGKDPRKYDPRLRPPVQPQEMEIDAATGMKNYIRNEKGTWDTSSAHVKRLVVQCIDKARAYRQTGDVELRDDAYRLLGSLLHTLEDFVAHSNWIELTLIEFGYESVFPHVAKGSKVDLPNGRNVYPLVTGIFGSADAMHSLLGEVSDTLMQLSPTQIKNELDRLHQKQKETEAAAKAQHAPGSMERIQSLMKDIETEYDCSQPPTSPASSAFDAAGNLGGVRSRKAKVVRKAAGGSCQLMNLAEEEYWRFVSAFDVDKFVEAWREGKDYLDQDFKLDNDDDDVSPVSSSGSPQTRRSVTKTNRLASRDTGGVEEGQKAHRLRKVISGIVRFRGEVMKKMRHILPRVRKTPKAVNLEHNIQIWILTHLGPLFAPLIELSANKLAKLSAELQTKDEVQFCVWDTPFCTNPTHSYLSKDHFRTLLNDPAGRVAQVIVLHTVNRIIQAWENPAPSSQDVATKTIEVLFHPAMYDPHSRVQVAMTTELRNWILSFNDADRAEILRRLESDSVRRHENIRMEAQGANAKMRWNPTGARVVDVAGEGISENPLRWMDSRYGEWTQGA